MAPNNVRTLQQSIRQFLTPSLWKQAHQHQAKKKRAGSRWTLQPLVLTLLLMTWATGDSQAERFETAKAFCIVCRCKQKRPGKTVHGFQKALAALPMSVLRVLADGVRAALVRLLKLTEADGFIPLGCDGTRLNCPRTPELERFLCKANRAGSAPSLWLTAVVHLRTGVPWCWWWGLGNACERAHLQKMLAWLPAATLLVADAGYVGYELTRALAGRFSFLIRSCSLATLYTTQLTRLHKYRDGEVLYWPKEAQKKGWPPLKVRLLCVRRKQKGTKSKSQDVWLITNVLDRKKLSLERAGQYYRWRWENEGLFRTYKGTLKKTKLASRTVKLIHREAEGSMLALQLLLAQGALAQKRSQSKASPRQILRAIRQELQACLKKRRPHFGKRLRSAAREQRLRTTAKEKRVWPQRAPHQPPKPPKILKLTKEIKQALDQLEASSA